MRPFSMREMASCEIPLRRESSAWVIPCSERRSRRRAPSIPALGTVT